MTLYYLVLEQVNKEFLLLHRPLVLPFIYLWIDVVKPPNSFDGRGTQEFLPSLPGEEHL